MRPLSLILISLLALTGCPEGSDGSSGSDGLDGSEGPPGPPGPAPEGYGLAWIDGDGNPLDVGGTPGGWHCGPSKLCGSTVYTTDADGVVWRVEIANGLGYPDNWSPTITVYTGPGCTGEGYVAAVTGPGVAFRLAGHETIHYVEPGADVILPGERDLVFLSRFSTGGCTDAIDGGGTSEDVLVEGGTRAWFSVDDLRDTGESYEPSTSGAGGVNIGIAAPLYLGRP